MVGELKKSEAFLNVSLFLILIFSFVTFNFICYFWHCAKDFLVTFVTKRFHLLLLALRKSNQNASAVLKKLKNRNKSYSDLNSGKRTTLQSFSACPYILYFDIDLCNLAKNLRLRIYSYFYSRFLRQCTKAIRISRAFLRQCT